jgi:hypothetical protein
MRLFFLILIAWSYTFCHAQKLSVESFELAPSDLSASTNERLDLNEKPCALVKVRVALPGAEFDGFCIGDIEYNSGEYWVYMIEGSNRLTLKHGSLLPLEVEFADYGIEGLKARHTYVMTLQVPSGVRLQREANVHGRYSLTIGENENITLKDARIRCMEMARAAAIKAEFGEMVTSDVLSSSTENYENELAKAQGDWLGDSKAPVVSVNYANGELTFTAEVWGKAREIIQAKTDLDWKILRGTEGQTESSTFNDMERFRIQFRSPIDGYVAIYLIEEGDDTSCLLPYPHQTNGQFQVKAGSNYTFFDRNIDPQASPWRMAVADKGHEIEKNQLVIIFSPNSFTKCNDTSSNPGNHDKLSSRTFQSWLLRCQRADKDMVVNKKWVTIKKNR